MNVRLTIIGPHEYSGYVTRVYNLIETLQLQHIITTHKLIPREQLEDVYHSHDIFLFPSIWEEPFSIVLLEAMAHGLAVIATQTGGSAEILRDRENCVIFPPGNAEELANRIELLIHHPELTEQIKVKAIETIHAHYALDKIVDEIEKFLTQIIQEHPNGSYASNIQ